MGVIFQANYPDPRDWQYFTVVILANLVVAVALLTRRGCSNSELAHIGGSEAILGYTRRGSTAGPEGAPAPGV